MPDIPGGTSLTQDGQAPDAEASRGKSAKSDKSQAAKAIEEAVNNTSSDEGLELQTIPESYPEIIKQISVLVSNRTNVRVPKCSQPSLLCDSASLVVLFP